MKKISVLLTIGSVVCFAIMVTSCRKEWEGAQTKNSDSLFLGISLGMEDRAFYKHCWDLNKQKILTHGPTNQNVEYHLTNALEDSVIMRFYPSFHEGKIYEMPVTFTYDKWAPWNKRYWADSLLVDMVGVFKKWYGGEFREMDHPVQGKVYVRFDGKRRINLFKKDDQFVMAVFTDMKVAEALKNQQKKENEQK
ncbi:MAG TPA: hypothetical protein VGD31_17070 [Sphingobacteriaceae bacterium]